MAAAHFLIIIHWAFHQLKSTLSWHQSNFVCVYIWKSLIIVNMKKFIDTLTNEGIENSTWSLDIKQKKYKALL